MNVFPKFGFSAGLRLAILCCGMLFGAAAAQAQTGTKSLPFDSFTWLNSLDAVTVLNTQIELIDQELTNTPPANPTPLKTKYVLYSAIRSSIQDGFAVRVAAETNFYNMAPGIKSVATASYPDMTPTNWQVLLDDMLDLLTI